ncbi:MAG: tyrosine-type recombinase/integrase [Gammaproteobacteria bacterium]|nr:tyrosine-type recombinase/integrase [Gammaproteobacteria bacterium]MCP5196669.1 tyrosine-type recombinase/integrase [Gammaproteobacteria bacterium]
MPLNEDAVQILRQHWGQHPQYVFTYKGNLITSPNGKAWRKAVKRAGIDNFHFHDLRHT